MSANYSETSITGTEWKRCVRMTFTNPHAGTGVVRFEEEKAISIDGHVNLTPVNELFVRAFAADGSFPLRNPETGATIGTSMTHAELYAVLYSLYIAEATARDA